MTAILVILFILVLATGLYLLMIGGRFGNPTLQRLKRYYYAHRGLHSKENGIPENSLTAFRLAAENGYGAELDVHLSKDGKLFVMHDESLARMTGINANICDLNASQLERIYLSGTKEPIPYFEEVLPIFAEARLPLMIELKPAGKRNRELVEKVLEALREYPNLLFCLESFDPIVMWYVRRLDKSIVRGQLSSDFRRKPEKLKFPLTFLVKNLMFNFLSRPDFISYSFKYRKALALRLCKKLYDVEIAYWTIRTMPQARQAIREESLVIFERILP
ncbi:MAG: glycerophosphodiester phosphodiesterase [Clostridia bacterium]|nr:glycerophosphodiester phosphodiesterase [Clostridia bacterium]